MRNVSICSALLFVGVGIAGCTNERARRIEPVTTTSADMAAMERDYPSRPVDPPANELPSAIPAEPVIVVDEPNFVAADAGRSAAKNP